MKRKTCCVFSYNTASEAMGTNPFETVEDFGGGGEGYSWSDGSRKLLECRNCGALFLNYRIKFLAMAYDQDGITYSYLLPVASRSEAFEYMEKYIGANGLDKSYEGLKIWLDTSKQPVTWHWNKQSEA